VFLRTPKQDTCSFILERTVTTCLFQSFLLSNSFLEISNGFICPSWNFFHSISSWSCHHWDIRRQFLHDWNWIYKSFLSYMFPCIQWNWGRATVPVQSHSCLFVRFDFQAVHFEYHLYPLTNFKFFSRKLRPLYSRCDNLIAQNSFVYFFGCPK
jgi:hypothetical protein